MRDQVKTEQSCLLSSKRTDDYIRGLHSSCYPEQNADSKRASTAQHNSELCVRATGGRKTITPSSLVHVNLPTIRTRPRPDAPEVAKQDHQSDDGTARHPDSFESISVCGSWFVVDALFITVTADKLKCTNRFSFFFSVLLWTGHDLRQDGEANVVVRQNARESAWTAAKNDAQNNARNDRLQFVTEASP